MKTRIALATGVLLGLLATLSMGAVQTRTSATIVTGSGGASVTIVGGSTGTPLPVVAHLNAATFPVPMTAHQGGGWNTAHQSSVVHVAVTNPASVTQVTGRTCHSVAAFQVSATSKVIHATTLQPRIYICSIVVGVQVGNGQAWSLVGGTGATCGTGSTPLIGSTVAAVGQNHAAAFSAVQATSWIGSTTAENDVCLVVGAGAGVGAVAGTIVYGGY